MSDQDTTAPTSTLSRWLRRLAIGSVILAVLTLIVLVLTVTVLPMWLLGSGAAHDSSKLIDDDCAIAGLFVPDDDGGLEAMTSVMYEASMQGEPQIANPTHKIMGLMVPAKVAGCRHDDHLVVSAEPRMMGRLYRWMLRPMGWVLGDQGFEIEGHTFIQVEVCDDLDIDEDCNGAAFGMVDGNLVIGTDRAFLQAGVMALTTEQEEHSSRRELLRVGLEGADASFYIRYEN